jgi:tetratricopeptide (TPR) repeat protein
MSGDTDPTHAAIPPAPDDARARYAAEKAALQQLLALNANARAAALEDLRASRPALADVMQRRLALSIEESTATETIAAAAPQIPRYRVLRELGRGGMGQVWLAERADGADQQRLAIKQIRADVADPASVRRFEAERRALARLDHPNIASLLDAGTDAAGRPYLVTPFVEGEPLQHYADRARLGVVARVQLLRQVAAALAHAHQQLIVHRDLKPANVLVEPASATRAARVRLLDFGIARLLDAQSELTADGNSMMTLRYAAPEQLRGEAQGVSCDLYALGVMAYELLSGASPYGALRDPAALLEAIARLDPPPLQRAANGERIRTDLAAIVAKLLRKPPEERYRSADAVLDELDRWLAGEPVAAMRGRLAYRLRVGARRHWGWIAAALALLLAGGLHLQRMDRQLEVSERERRKADETANFMITLFQSARPVETGSGSMTALDLIKLGSQRLLDPVESASLSPEGRAALLLNTGHAFYQLDQQDTARRMFEAAAKLHAESPHSGAALHAEALRFIAMSHYAQGDTGAALDTIDVAHRTLQQARQQEHAEYRAVLNARCVYLGSLGRNDEADDCYRELLARHRELGIRDLDAVSALVNIAAFETTRARPRDAEALLREAQAALVRTDALEVGNTLPITLRRHLANSLRDQERFAEAATLYQEVVAETVVYEGKDSRGLIAPLVGLASSLVLAGDAAAAEAPIRDALRLTEDAWPPAHKNTLNVRLEYARWLFASGALAAARAELEQIQAARAQQQPVDVGGRAMSAALLAHLQCGAGQRKLALAGFEHALADLARPGMASQLRQRQARQWQAECAAAGAR